MSEAAEGPGPTLAQSESGSGPAPLEGPGLPRVVGHQELQDRIRRAAETSRMPQSLLFHGPEGVGKQTLALWTAALLQCERLGPCGACRSCRLAARLEHPDIHWHFPLARPKRTSTAKKFREKLEAARLEELERRRSNPLQVAEDEGVTGIYLAAVEEIRAQASRRPAMGDRVVFVIGHADRMVPQRSSPEAANAFLKLLEEPPPFAVLILTSSRPAALLPTIRSRSLSVRMPTLADEEVEAFVRDRLDLDAAEAERTARLAQGSIGHALRIAGGLESETRQQAAALIRAALSPRDADRYACALEFSARGARGEFSATLVALSELLRDLLGLASGTPESALDPERARRLAGERRLSARGVVEALDAVERALGAAAGNTNPQAVAARLLFEMHGSLAGPRGALPARRGSGTRSPSRQPK